MFDSLFSMKEHCPRCRHRFMREPGFFQGAMYVSYVVGIVEFALLALIGYALIGERFGIEAALVVAVVLHLLLVPQLFQYSRVVWAHVSVVTSTERERRAR